MESTGVPGCIHASEAARALLRNEAWVPTGGIEVKGKGSMNTYLWAPPGSEEQRAAFVAAAAAVAAQQQQKHPLQQRTLNQKTSSSPQLAPVKKTSAALPPALEDGSRLPTILGSSGASGSIPCNGTAAATQHSTGPPIALTMNSAGGFAHVWASKTGSATGGGGADESVRDLVKILLPVGGP
ncbi:hypothetical protein Vretimale_16290 [Volvox reticuliferus]|nr:hypothetical protein Vretifemale_16900 [Volvox reticuliferus]GIM13065.1 hypothetical protein Vretimale_16290 [Volvox reticuliferus]